MPNIFPNNFPKPGWETQFDVEAARKLLPSVEELVPNSRYGKSPELHGVEFSQAAEFGIYEFQPSWIFPATRIRANESKQNYSVMPKKEYFDVLWRCRDCRGWFIFFAKEQQYWFEELRFFVDSQCTHCPECRRKHRKYRAEEREFAELRRTVQPDPDQLTRLLELTISLWHRKFIQNRHQLDAVIRIVSRLDPAHVLLEDVRSLRRSCG